MNIYKYKSIYKNINVYIDIFQVYDCLMNCSLAYCDLIENQGNFLGTFRSHFDARCRAKVASRSHQSRHV